MKNSKRISNIIAGSALVFGSMVTPNVLAAMPTFAEEAAEPNIPTVFVTMADGSTEQLYTASGCQSNKAGTAEYCAEGNVLTLKNYDASNIGSTDLDDLVVVLEGNNAIHNTSSLLGAVIASSGNLTIKGTGTLKSTDAGVELIGAKKDIIIESGVIDFTADGSQLFRVADSDAHHITINGGEINYTVKEPEGDKVFGAIVSNMLGGTYFTMNGGTINAPNTLLQAGSYYSQDKSGSKVLINGGTLNVTQVVANDFEITGGNLTAIENHPDANLILTYGVAAFKGGKSTLQKPVDELYPFAIVESGDIVLGQDMCMSGDAKIIKQDTTSAIMMGSMDTIVIEQGTCPVNPPAPDPGTGDNDNPKVPNTGFETSQAILATIVGLPTIIAAVILGRFFYRRYSQRVSFKK